MSIIGTIEMSYHVQCKCGKDCKGSTLKRAYLKLAWHVRTCELVEDPPSFLKVAWELFWWKQR